MDNHSRLRWQCRRGMRELDVLLQGFLDSGYDDLSDAQQQTFYALLKTADNQLLEYLMGRTVPDDQEAADVVSAIRYAVTP
ncbi:MAG: succinate dehydrogenase assembly factor 2 [Gammaproteobacteria bacterium]|nr:succinate dehydrogenase assembly factor 2 [Gammaproteobacteria bacterium]